MTTVVPDLSEAGFQQQITELAALLGWRCLHVRKSIGRRRGGPAWQTTTSVNGWVDLLCWRPRTGQLFAAELKSQNGKLTDEQRQVLAELNACGIPAFCWRPADWDEVQRILKEGP